MVRAEPSIGRSEYTEVRPRVDYAAGPGPRVTVPQAKRFHGALAAVNGGFWLDDDDPDGWFVRDGQVMSDTTGGRFWKRNLRGGIGFADDGRTVVGVPTWDAAVTIAGERRIVRGVNRRPIGAGETIIFTVGVWHEPPVEGGVFLRVLRPPRLDVAIAEDLPILRRSTTPLTLDHDTMVVWLDDEAARGLDPDAGSLRLDVRMADAWSGLDQAISAGPWIIENAMATSTQQWRSEGFTGDHTDRRHPRTAVGATSDGFGIVAVVDGRWPGHSVGTTVPEVATWLTGLGVTDAVLLDGGGSSQLAINGELANRPCCDEPLRPVATVLLFERG